MLIESLLVTVFSSCVCCSASFLKHNDLVVSSELHHNHEIMTSYIKEGLVEGACDPQYYTNTYCGCNPNNLFF